MDLVWRLGARMPAAEYRVFRTAFVDGVHPQTGATKRFSLIEAVDWINVIAMTPEQRVVLIRQFRVGAEEVCLEIPGGMVDPGEAPAEAAARELAEETGYVGQAWHELGSVQANPAFMNNSCHNFLATGCQQLLPTSLDAGEDIDVLLFSLQEVGRMLREGTIRHSMVIAAFFGYLQAGAPCGPLFAR